MAENDVSVMSALARATVYRMFALAFQPPNEAGGKSVGAYDGFETLKVAFQGLDAVSARQVNACITRLRREVPTLAPLAAQYSQVFGRGGYGLICPCETEYDDDESHCQQPRQLVDISGYYLAFGLTPLAASGLRQDHIACECEFMVFLNLKQALFVEECARTAEAAETLDATRQAERTFFHDHLGRFGFTFALALSSNDDSSYYATWGLLFLAWLNVERARLGLDGAAGTLPPRFEPQCLDLYETSRVRNH